MDFTYSLSIRRAVVAGALAGLVTAVFVALVGESSIDAAIAIEEAAAEGESGEDPLFSRGAQVIGGISGAVVYGIMVGVVFGTVFASVRHRLTLANDFRRSILLAAIGFVTTALIPALKYPANPPAVGDPDTVAQRTIYYFSLLFAAIVLAVVIGTFYRWLRNRSDQATTVVATTALSLAAFTFVFLAWPSSPDSVPDDFPPSLLWEFRLESLAGLALLWVALGLGFGWLNRPRPVDIDLTKTTGPAAERNPASQR